MPIKPSGLYSTESSGNASVLWGTVACIIHAPPFICQRFSRACSTGQLQAYTKKWSNSRPLGLPTGRLRSWVFHMWGKRLLSCIMELLQRFVSPFNYFFKFDHWPKFSQMATAVSLGKSFKWASCFNGLKYMWLQDLLCCCEQWHHWLLWERSSLFGTSRGSDHY